MATVWYFSPKHKELAVKRNAAQAALLQLRGLIQKRILERKEAETAVSKMRIEETRLKAEIEKYIKDISLEEASPTKNAFSEEI